MPWDVRSISEAVRLVSIKAIRAFSLLSFRIRPSLNCCGHEILSLREFVLVRRGRIEQQSRRMLRPGWKAAPYQATMDKPAQLPMLRNQKPTWAKAASLARDWQLYKLAERLAKLAP